MTDPTFGLRARIESWPIRGGFRISRGAKVQADVLVVELSDGLGSSGWGEAVPYPRYGESTTTSLRYAVAAGDRLAAGAPGEASRRAFPTAHPRRAGHPPRPRPGARSSAIRRSGGRGPPPPIR
ncbi:MAG: hypothetical protein AAGA56_28710, partial [Myxococcota bacterium]